MCVKLWEVGVALLLFSSSQEKFLLVKVNLDSVLEDDCVAVLLCVRQSELCALCCDADAVLFFTAAEEKRKQVKQRLRFLNAAAARELM